MGARVVEAEVAVGRSQEKFDADGRLVDEEVRAQLREVLATLAAATSPALVAA